MDPSRLAKRQKLTPVREQTQMVPDPEVITRREVDTREHLSIHEHAGATGQAMAVDLMYRVAHSISIFGRDLWNQLRVDDSLAQIELGIHSNVVVGNHSLVFCVFILLKFFFG